MVAEGGPTIFLKSEARPIVILQPMGPVVFVFDVSETEKISGVKNVRELPAGIEKPFEIQT